MSYPQLLSPRVKGLIDHVKRFRLIYLFSSIAILSGLCLLALSGGSAAAKESREKKEIESIQALLQMRTQMTDIQKSLLGRIEALESGRRASRASSPVTKVFLEVKPSDGFKQVTDLKSELYIPRGSVFQARLLTSIKTALSATVVMAETTRTFEMGSNKRIPAHSKIIGESIYDPTMKGVIVRFNTLTLPNGEQFDGLDLLALSENAWPQLEGIVFDNSGIEMATALSFGFLSGFSSGAQDRESTIAGSTVTPSVKNSILSGLSVSSFQVAEQALEKVKSQAVEYVVVPAATPIFVLFNSKWNLPKGGIKR